LDSLFLGSYSNFEVIMVDNNSKDASLRILKAYIDKRLKVIPLKSNIGFAQANNLGIKHSTGDILVFLNNDTKVDTQWLTELHKTFSDSSVGAAQSMLLKMSGGVYSLGGSLDYSGRMVPVGCLWVVSPSMKAENQLFWGCGAALAIRSSVIKEIGGFDPKLPNDEVDICWRALLLGQKIVLSSKSVVYHYGSGSFGKKLNPLRVYYSEQSVLTSAFRNFSFKNLVVSFIYKLAYLPLATALDLLVRRRVDVFLKRAKAYVDFLKNLRLLNSQRVFVQLKLRKVPDEAILKLMIKPSPFLSASVYNQETAIK
jgi:GT2 family glycosyltransferase